MHPEAPKKEDDLAEFIDARVDKLRRLESHGEEYKLAAVFKINALMMLTTGKAREYFDLWEADSGKADAAKSYTALLNKLKDFARRKKLGSNVQRNMQQGSDPVDVGTVGENWDNGPVYYGEDAGIDAVAKGEGKKGGKGAMCYTCGGKGHIA